MLPDEIKHPTTHELAEKLLKLPDLPVVIEGWTTLRSSERVVAKITDYSDEVAIICRERK